MARRTKRFRRGRAQRKSKRHLIGGVLALVAGLWVAGFANFILNNSHETDAAPASARNIGIVVLTGTPDRILWGMDALSEGRGARLLISGVNEITTRDELRGLVSDPQNRFECCVDLDYASRNTIANANHAIAWAHEHRFEGLWVVTSYYHMPRALLEFHHRDPSIAIYPLRVEPTNYSANNWWYPNTFRILAWEYTKYELALMRIRLASLFGRSSA